MYKVLGGDQREYGPVNADEVRRWIAEGRLNGRSLVKAEGGTEWQPLATFSEFASAFRAQSPPGGGEMTAEPPLDSNAWMAEVTAREPRLRVADCLSNAWTLMSSSYGLLLAACAIIWGIGTAKFIPLFDLGYRVLAGVFYGGLYLVVLKRIRGEPTAPGEVFAGFKLAFAQLMLAGLISYLLAALGFVFCALPGIYLSIAWVFSVPLVADKRLEFWSAMELSRQVVGKVWFQVLGLVLLVFLPTILVSIYTGALAVSKVVPQIQQMFGAGPLDPAAFVERILRVNLANFSLSFFSRLVLLFNLPFALAALMYAYENLFGPRPKTPA